MVIVRSKDKIRFLGHNGRKINIIVSYNEVSHKFHLTKPNVKITWNDNESIPIEVINEFCRTTNEIKALKTFITTKKIC